MNKHKLARNLQEVIEILVTDKNDNLIASITDEDVIAADEYKVEIMVFTNSYGETLREMRLKAGLSRYELWKLTGVRDSTIKFWEEGLTVPTLLNFSRVLKALNESYTLGVGDPALEE